MRKYIFCEMTISLTVLGACEKINDLPRWHSESVPARNMPAKAGDKRDGGLILGWGKIPWRKKWRSTPVFLPEKSHGQRSLVVYIPEGLKKSDKTGHTCMVPGMVPKSGNLCYA